MRNGNFVKDISLAEPDLGKVCLVDNSSAAFELFQGMRMEKDDDDDVQGTYGVIRKWHSYSRLDFQPQRSMSFGFVTVTRRVTLYSRCQEYFTASTYGCILISLTSTTIYQQLLSPTLPIVRYLSYSSFTSLSLSLSLLCVFFWVIFLILI